MIILYLIGALGLGRLLVNVLPFAWHRAEAWALAVVFGYFFSAWMLLIACSLLGFPAGVAVVFALLLGCWLLPKTRRSPDRLSLATTRQTALWLVTTCVLSLIISYILYRQMLGPGPGGAYSAGEADGDLGAHLTIMSNVAYTPRFTWRFSLMAGTYLTYHFLIDFLSGMIVRWGGSLRLGLLLVSIPLCLALVQLLFFLGFRALKTVRGAALFTAIFLLNGSAGGFIPEIGHLVSSGAYAQSFFHGVAVDYCETTPYNFGNVISNLVPQRSFQFGLPVFCAVMLLAYQLNRGMNVRERRRVLVFVGVLAGLLPLGHIHSFFICFVVLAALAAFSRNAAGTGEWLIALATCLILALPQVAYQTFANRHDRFVRFQPGWGFQDSDFPYAPHYAGLLLYILVNFGLILILTAVSYRHLKGQDIVRHLVLVGAAIFLASFLFAFQPSVFDNAKFLFYAYLFFSLSVARYLARQSRAKKWQWAPLTAALVASGIMSVLWQSCQYWLLIPDRDFAEAGVYRRHMPADALVLTSDNDKQPLWELAGQPVVEGFVYYLGDYGLPTTAISADIRKMYAGGDDAIPLLQKYKVQYVLIGRYERMGMRVINEAFYSSRFLLVYQRNGISIYQIRRRHGSPAIS